MQKRLIDAHALLQSEAKRCGSIPTIGTGYMNETSFKRILDQAPTVVAYTEEQMQDILQFAEDLTVKNKELEKEREWLKSCLNCEIRKECPRHCGKVVHGCDHWVYGDNAVEVVRCRDCKHYVVRACACRHENFNGIIRSDGFCSYGEKENNL